MAENSKINWTTHTFNPWEGCTKVSPGCAHCYAELRNRRFNAGANWGKGAPRRRTVDRNWEEVIRWNRRAEQTLREYHIECGYNPDYAASVPPPERPRVFCASLADWLDDEVPIEWLSDLLSMIRRTPALDWLLLTKRPQLWRPRMEAAAKLGDIGAQVAAQWLTGNVLPNIWAGTTVEDQPRADERQPALLTIPARVRFLSCEPLLGQVNLDIGHPKHRTAESYHAMIDWVICGGESGPSARPMDERHAAALLEQCSNACVAFWMKQMGGVKDARHELAEIPARLRVRQLPVPPAQP